MRIAYDGLGTAGKTTNVRALQQAFPTRSRRGVEGFGESRSGRTLYFDWLELDVGHFDEARCRCQILSVPGQFVYAQRRFHLLGELDGVVLVCDSTPRGVDAGRIALAFLRRVLEANGTGDVPVVVQANKQDLPDALGPDEVAARLVLARELVVPASAISDEGVRLTLVRALDLVRRRVRAGLEGASVDTLPPAEATSASVYEALVAKDAEEEPNALIEALELALEQVK